MFWWEKSVYEVHDMEGALHFPGDKNIEPKSQELPSLYSCAGRYCCLTCRANSRARRVCKLVDIATALQQDSESPLCLRAGRYSRCCTQSRFGEPVVLVAGPIPPLLYCCMFSSLQQEGYRMEISSLLHNRAHTTSSDWGLIHVSRELFFCCCHRQSSMFVLGNCG